MKQPISSHRCTKFRRPITAWGSKEGCCYDPNEKAKLAEAREEIEQMRVNRLLKNEKLWTPAMVVRSVVGVAALFSAGMWFALIVIFDADTLFETAKTFWGMN